jgi:hypothetical protein
MQRFAGAFDEILVMPSYSIIQSFFCRSKMNKASQIMDELGYYH